MIRITRARKGLRDLGADSTFEAVGSKKWRLQESCAGVTRQRNHSIFESCKMGRPIAASATCQKIRGRVDSKCCSIAEEKAKSPSSAEVS